MLKRTVVLLLGFITLWEFVRFAFQLPFYILPSLLSVAKALYTYKYLLLQHAIPTIFEIIVGFSLGILLACLTAITLSLFRSSRAWALPVIIISQSVPTFVIAPMLVLWFGYGLASKIAVTVIMTFFPICSTFYDGLQQTPVQYFEMAQLMQATRFRILFYLQIPAALPSLASGMRVAATFAPMAAIIGEWVGASRGLGLLILNANARLQIDMMFAALFTVVLLSLVLYYSVDKALKHFIDWQSNQGPRP